MATRVRFRFNKITGEVEELLVDDQNHRLPEAEHDRRAAEVGALLAVAPQIVEVLDGAIPAAPPRRPETAPPEETTEEQTSPAEPIAPVRAGGQGQ